MEKRKVSIVINGQPCSFYSDDTDEYIKALENKANEAIKQTAGNTVYAMIALTDQLMRMEQAKQAEPVTAVRPSKEDDKPEKPKKARKNMEKTDDSQMSMWDLI